MTLIAGGISISVYLHNYRKSGLDIFFFRLLDYNFPSFYIHNTLDPWLEKYFWIEFDEGSQF